MKNNFPEGKEYEVVVIGAGLAGLSTAYHLAESGTRDIAVLEQETKLGGHASGRNAGMIRQPVEDPVLAQLTGEGRASLERAAGMGWEDIRFEPNGSVLLSRSGKTKSLEKIRKASEKAGIDVWYISKEEAHKIHPALIDARFKKVLYCATDALVDIGPLLSGFLKSLKSLEIPVFLGQTLKSIRKVNDVFVLQTADQVLLAKKVVNAAGAWAGLVGLKAGAVSVPLKAYRRHLFFSKQHAPPRAARWPFIWDIELGFYFRPMEDSLLLSPCDHTWQRLTTGNEQSLRNEKVDVKIKQLLLKKAKSFSPYFKGLKVSDEKSGLRTMTPDGRFVIGEDPKLKGFFWCAGLGGHGVTTCFSVGRLAGDLVSGKSRDPKLVRALSPKRFL